MKILGKKISLSITNVDEKKPASAYVRRKIMKPETQVIRAKAELGGFKLALLTAESILNPNRHQLYRYYKQIDLDAHLTAAVQQRKNLTLSRKFKAVNSVGEENEQLTRLINKKWFYDFIDISLDSIFWGYSLIQFGDLIKDEFVDVDLVPRIYVKPEFKIVVETTAATVGIDYTKDPYRNWCIGVGKCKDLGLFMKAAPLVIWKQNAIGAWAEFQQLFGVPTRIGKTSARDEESRKNMENFLKDMGTAAYGVFDLDDIVELIESRSQDAYQVFDMMIARCNSEISKLILGQTGTMDEKSFVGSAEVMERVLANYSEFDETFITGVMNYQLIPLLESHGIMFNGCTITCEEDEEMSLPEAIKIDDVLLKYYDIDPLDIEKKYGTKVKKKAEPKDPGVMKVKNSLDEYYS